MPGTKQTARKSSGGFVPRASSVSGEKRRLSDNESDEPSFKRQKRDDNDDLPIIQAAITIFPSGTESVVKSLGDLLAEMVQATCLSVGGRCSSLPLLPELTVDGIGLVPLPLSEQQIPFLFEQCAKSAFGHGLHTKKDENVRNSFELTADKFKLNHPSWDQAMNKLVRKTALELGCDASSVDKVKTEPYKLVIYEKDGHFVPHRDTQKIDGMFATMVVQLPCEYTNVGDKPTLVVKHKSKPYEYYFGTKSGDDEKKDSTDSSKYNIYYSAHYCDLQHSVNQVASGTRVVVTYNLYWTGPKNIAPKVSNGTDLNGRIDDVIRGWKEHAAIAVNLEHFYTDAEVQRDGINALKGADAARVQALKAGSSEPLAFFLCVVTRSVEEYDTGGYNIRSYDDCDWSERDRSEKIDDIWYSENGTPCEFGKFTDIDLETHCIGYDRDGHGHDHGKWGEMDQTHEGYLGNQGATRSTTYEKYIAVFVKASNELQVIMKLKGIPAGLQWIRSQAQNENENENLPGHVQAIVDNFDVKNRNDIHDVLKLLRDIGNLPLIVQFIQKLIDQKNIGIFASGVDLFVPLWCDIIVQYGWTEEIKTLTLQWFDCLLTDQNEPNNIVGYYKLPTLVKTESEADVEDDDIIMLRPARGSARGSVNESKQKKLDECVLDLFARLWQIAKIKIDLEGEGHPLGELNDEAIECILKLMINAQCSNEEMSLFAAKYEARYVDQAKQRLVVQRILSWKTQLEISSRSLEVIQIVIKCRLNFLKAEVEKGEPQFSWKLPVHASADAKFCNFLQSDRQTFRNYGFSGIKDARRWKDDQTRLSNNGYGCLYLKYQEAGRGTNAHVVVTKINVLLAEYTKKVEEMTHVSSLIVDRASDVDNIQHLMSITSDVDNIYFD